MTKSKNRIFYSLAVNDKTAEIDIYGDICSEPWAWFESDTCAFKLSQQLAELNDVDEIFVNINSYGGEVAEGLAIYNALKRHKAKITTRVDGFACSIASVIFMAGNERIMHNASLLMIHNAWMSFFGGMNAAELRKQAADLDAITQASKNAYMSHINITEDELSELMDAESWIAPQDALDMGFATAIEDVEQSTISQNARMAVFNRLSVKQEEVETDEDEDDVADVDVDTDTNTEPETDSEMETDTPPDEEPETDDSDDEDESEEQEAANQSMAAFFMALNNYLGR